MLRSTVRSIGAIRVTEAVDIYSSWIAGIARELFAHRQALIGLAVWNLVLSAGLVLLAIRYRKTPAKGPASEIAPIARRPILKK